MEPSVNPISLPRIPSVSPLLPREYIQLNTPEAAPRRRERTNWTLTGLSRPIRRGIVQGKLKIPIPGPFSITCRGSTAAIVGTWTSNTIERSRKTAARFRLVLPLFFHQRTAPNLSPHFSSSSASLTSPPLAHPTLDDRATRSRHLPLSAESASTLPSQHHPRRSRKALRNERL